MSDTQQSRARCPNYRLSPLSGSVGEGGTNREDDVRVVQGALNQVAVDRGGADRRLATDGDIGPRTIAAIRRFQDVGMSARRPDGLVEPGGITFGTLRLLITRMRIVIDLDLQVVSAYEGSTRRYRFDCVTGYQSHPTEPGPFRIIRRHHPYTSRTYGVPMNYAQFFTTDGKALHQYHGLVPLSAIRLARSGSDFFGSHGCVRLTESDARTLYSWGVIGTPVHVRR